MVQFSHPYMTTGKTIALTIWTFVGKVMCLHFDTLSGFVTAFLPRSSHLLISWLQSPSTEILEPKGKTKIHILLLYLPEAAIKKKTQWYDSNCMMFGKKQNYGDNINISE